MKFKMITLLVVAFAAAAIVAGGCGAGGEASFSPDPSVADLFGDNPAGGGAGGGDNEIDVPGGENKTDNERDCFLDGFCFRTCQTAAECPAGFSCIMKVCTFDCQSDAECGTGGTCNDVGLCETVSGEEIPSCTSSSECGEGRFCNADGDCETIPVLLGCRNDADCPLRQFCNEAHSCELFPLTGVECSSDEECPGNYYCGSSSQCEQECRSDYQCADGRVCENSGRCVIPGPVFKLKSFSFNALGAVTDPAGPITFTSTNFKIDQAVITPAGRNQILSSSRFRLIGNTGF